jgi:hypothetical protein
MLEVKQTAAGPGSQGAWQFARISGISLRRLERFSDRRGLLSLIDNSAAQLGHSIDRCFFISDVPQGESRAGHANTASSEVLIAAGGSLTVEVDDGFETRIFRLSPLDEALIVPPGIWLRLSDFEPGALCAVLASGSFSENSRLADRSEFSRIKQEADAKLAGLK